MTPLDWLTRARIDRAQELLLSDAAMPVKAVALSLGFASSQQFSTWFKRFTGQTATAFREQFVPAEAQPTHG